MNSAATQEIFEISTSVALSEVGGGHGQKGIDFQRFWAIQRMIELEENGAEDFLILIEAIQDVAELDSCINPTSICLYQVKKKDRNEWSWNQLTLLQQPSKTSKGSSKVKKSNTVAKSKKSKSASKFSESPIGKLFLTLIAFEELDVSGKFISNSGCDLPLSGGGNAATSVPTALDDLSDDYKELLKHEMAAISTEKKAEGLLPNIIVQKVPIPVDDPRTHLIGSAHQFLENRSPRHAGQARSFIDALLVVVGPKGAKTDKCKTFEELQDRHGFSKKQFAKALADLEHVPDHLEHLESWLNKLLAEGFDIMDITSIRVECTALYRRQLLGEVDESEKKLVELCDNYVDKYSVGSEIKPFLESAYSALQKHTDDYKKSHVYAQILLRAIKKCVDQI